MTALLEIDGLTKRFGGVVAVDGCSFAVPEGTVTALIGPNGSGKTTVFNLVTGYLVPDGGSVAFRGRALRRPDPASLYRKGLARTFQQARVFPRLTVLDNLVLAVQQPWTGMLRGRVGRADAARAGELLTDFGLDHLDGRLAGELSYG
nr:ATP-binding cassette domain-containing protein [Actinomycetota bacterium]